MNTLREAAQQAETVLRGCLEHPDAADAVVALQAALAEQEPVESSPYNLKRIAWELERTAMSDGYYGNALRVAKDLPGITPKDRSVLDRYATGTQTGTDHVHLQWLAQWLYEKDERTEAPQPRREPLTDEEIEEINVSLTGRRDLSRLFARAIEAAIWSKT